MGDHRARVPGGVEPEGCGQDALLHGRRIGGGAPRRNRQLVLPASVTPVGASAPLRTGRKVTCKVRRAACRQYFCTVQGKYLINVVTTGGFVRLMHMPRHEVQDPRQRRRRGQSLVEFALVAPVLLLLLLVAIDLGRIFLGWVNLQQMTRLAADYAAQHASAWTAPIDGVEQSRYRQKVINDARQINCQPENPIPDPVFGAGTALGAPVSVTVSCRFSVITPIISNLVGDTILVTSSTTFPIKEGAVATVPGGGAPIAVPPVAKFVGSPLSGYGPLVVTYSSQSTGAPSSQVWDFSVGSSGTGSGGVSQDSSFAVGPHTVTYSCDGAEGATCTFGASLTVSNPGGSDVEVKSDYVTVTVPPAAGPIAEFTANPRSGITPQTVSFTFVDVRGGAIVYTDFAWDLDGNGSFEASGQSPTRTYTVAGSYDISLRVTDSLGGTNTQTKVGYIVIGDQICTVPDFANVKKNAAQRRWDDAGFMTRVQFQPGQGNYTIRYQSLTGGTINPPSGCDAVITVGP